MTRVRLRSGARFGVWAACVLATVAAAQDAQVSASPGEELVPYELFQARLRYGASVRSGAQADQGPGVSYSGVTPNDLAVQGWAWFLLDGMVGAFTSFQREGFALFDGPTKVTGGGLVRFSIGPAGRIALGPVRLEANAGYAFQQLPFLGASSAPTLQPANRHAVLLAARGVVDLGRVEAEARFELPIALTTSTARGAAGSSGFGVGGGVRVNVFDVGSLRWGVLADVGYLSDSLTDAAGLSSTQSVVRIGGAVDLKWREGTVGGLRFGSLTVEVIDAQTGAALPGATVAIGTQTATTGPDGRARLESLLPGSVNATATVGGYQPQDGAAEIEGGRDLSLRLKLDRELPKVGSLAFSVVGLDGKPLGKVKLEVGEKRLETSDSGEASLADLPPGPISVKASLEGYQVLEEAAAVAAGKVSRVALTLVPSKKALPATITGIVRSTAGGAPITADLEVPQARLKTRASAQGNFSFQVPGGTYTVNISAPGYLAQSKSVVVKDGDQAIFNVDLHPK